MLYRTHVDWLTTLALTVPALIYLWGWNRLRHGLSNVLPLWRLMSFTGGMLLLWVALASPLAALDHQLLTAHMAQHLLVMTVAAPMILLGAPAVVLLPALSRRFVSAVQRNPATRGFARIITHPVFCWLASTCAVIGWHVPAMFELGLESGPWHDVEHISFLAAGLLFWWPVVQPWPSIARWPGWSVPLYLFLATLPCDALSAFLTLCNRVVYPHYLSMPRISDISPLGDQEFAGALMWIFVTFVYLSPAAIVTIRLLSPQRRVSSIQVV